MIRISRLRLRLTETQIRSATMPVAARGVASVCHEIETLAVYGCPVRTGVLRAHHRVTVNPATASGRVSNTADYAEAVHDGTRPHTIRPRHGGVLRFVTGGRVVYATVVHHPGSRGQPWLTDAARRVAATREGVTFRRAT